MALLKLLSLLAVALAATATSASAIGIIVNGLANGGNSIGQYVVSGQTYWWVGIEPGAVPLDNSSQSGAQVYALRDGWLAQTFNRSSDFDAGTPAGAAVLAKQVAIIEYVLDAYLPWDTLAGASGRFLEQNGDYHNYTSNDPFLNAMFAAEAFIGQTEPRYTQLDFTNLSDYTDTFAGLGDATDDARSALFQDILTDVAAKDAAAFFATYTPQHGYATIGVPGLPSAGFMDGLMIGYGNPVPEPGSALLIATSGLLCALRRRRQSRAK